MGQTAVTVDLGTNEMGIEMRIAVYGGTGMIGSRVVTEAVARGHDVTAISRSGDAVPGVSGESGSLTTVAGDAASATQVGATAGNHDVIVSAIGPSRTGGDPQTFLDTIDTLTANVGQTRLIVVGGAGSLLANGIPLHDHTDFPAVYKPEALIQGAALEHLRATDGVDWTYLSPAPEIAPGERTGSYVLGEDAVVGYTISAEDYAVALVDEIETPAHRRSRFCVAAG